MGFRIVFIENEVAVKLKLNNLIINNGEGDIWIPVDDINMIVLDNPKITITTRVLSTIAEHNIGIIFCDMEHLPIGFYSSYDNHSRASKIIGYQINMDNLVRNELWKNIIIAKIENQKKTLEKLGCSESVINSMKEFIGEVEPGDPNNRESFAAKIYFNEMYGQGFTRRNDDIVINSLLNYGYTIIRSYIARLCVGYGLNTQIGLHHKNEYNRFNLTDDLIEPIRPFVDYYATNISNDEEYLTPELRRKLVNMLNHKVKHKEKTMYLSNMIEEYISEYAAYIQGKTDNIGFPDIDGYEGV